MPDYRSWFAATTAEHTSPSAVDWCNVRFRAEYHPFITDLAVAQLAPMMGPIIDAAFLRAADRHLAQIQPDVSDLEKRLFPSSGAALYPLFYLRGYLEETWTSAGAFCSSFCCIFFFVISLYFTAS